MNRRKVFWIASSGLTLLIVGAGLLYALNLITADTVKSEPVSIQDYSEGFGYRPNTLFLQSQKIGQKFEHRLIKKNGLFKKNILLSGFEEKVSSCQEKNLKFSDEGVICLAGTVGAHSLNLEIVALDSLTPLSFQLADGGVVPNIYSDLPLFTFEDFNQDGIGDTAVFNRNYDANPLEKAVKNYYLRSGLVYKFERSEDFTYNQ